MKRVGAAEEGFTMVELAIALVIFAVVSVSFFALYISLVHSTVIAQREAVALTIATNQMEYLRTQPYDQLVVGSPTTSTKTEYGVKYTITTEIKYVDDAYDGCGSYPDTTTEKALCRNYPPPTGSATDGNPQDYKQIHVSVTDNTGDNLASQDTYVASKVSETASSTGALFVKVVDGSGNALSGASVEVKNTTVSPTVDETLTSDSNGLVAFYGLTPDSGYDYVVTASDSGYSTLSTIAPSGTLQPTYPSQKILTQQSSYVTLTLKQQGTNSLAIETTDVNGNPLGNASISLKGGYKKYTDTSNTTYYYNGTASTDSSGLGSLQNLVPGPYYFCGDNGDSGCKVGGSTYYLAAAVPYGGGSPLEAIAVPEYDPSNPPSTMFNYGGTNYLQKVRLIFTPDVNFPRVFTLSPGTASLATSSLSSFSFAITGANLPCAASANNCSTTVKFTQGANTYTAACTGPQSGTGVGKQLGCSVDLTGISAGNTQLVISANGDTLTLPASPLLGGLIVGS
ncbi:MAG TPA: prepilin-type N-terminal cleavage/methylation domain-containing protein [Candidatus Saccharimonadales bacterium]|nr:prepilin-type N-terminal cleavage/methylation domain-containing protein [Candidatus Saccharimonadales bacterium]